MDTQQDPVADSRYLMRLYRRRRRGGSLRPEQHRRLNSLTTMELGLYEQIADGLDRSDRELRRARRAGIAVIDAGRYLPPLTSPVSTRTRPRERHPRRRSSTRSSARSGDSGDSELPPRPAGAVS
jgi:hypothetical protein